MGAQVGHELRDARLAQESDGLRKVIALGVFPGAVDEVAQQQVRHVHEHQADEDLVGVETVAQQRHDCRPDHAAQHATDEHEDDDAAAEPGDLDALALPDEAAWEVERKPFLLY